LCNDPYWLGFENGFDGKRVDKDMIYTYTNPTECLDRCRNEHRCADAFWLDLSGGYTCVIYYDTTPCTSYFIATWATPIHWKAYAPICDSNQQFMPSESAGYFCGLNGESVGDSNFGGTYENCTGLGGAWLEYNCTAADDYLVKVDSETADILRMTWQPKCCEGPTEICGATKQIIPSAIAGYSCGLNGESVGDSNFGGTYENCTGQGGEWQEYNCTSAEAVLSTIGEF